MSDELVFYTNPMSRGRIVRWMLEEVGEPYRTEIIGYGPEMKSPEYRAVNPLGKVPAVVRGDAVVTECAAICAWLADAYPGAGLAPPQGRRAAYYRWLFFGAGPLEAAIINRSFGFDVPEDAAGRVGYAPFEIMMDALEAAVTAEDYVAGAQFSAADVYLGAQVGWGLQFGTIEDRPAFRAYWERISDRAAHRRAREIDDALIEKAKG